MNRKKEEEIYKKILKRKIELRITDKRQQTVTNTQITVERIRQEKKRKQMKDRKKAKGEREREINKYKGKKRRTEKEFKKQKNLCSFSTRSQYPSSVDTQECISLSIVYLSLYLLFFRSQLSKKSGKTMWNNK